MTKKPNGRFLLTWNEEKHPEVTAFFEGIDQGLYSHTLRNVIKYYMRNKGSQSIKNGSNHFIESDSEPKEKNNVLKPTKEKTLHNISENDNYTDFDPNNL